MRLKLLLAGRDKEARTYPASLKRKEASKLKKYLDLMT